MKGADHGKWGRKNGRQGWASREGETGSGKGDAGIGENPKTLKRRGARETGEREMRHGERATGIGKML